MGQEPQDEIVEQGARVTKLFRRKVYDLIDANGALSGSADGQSVLITGAAGLCEPTRFWQAVVTWWHCKHLCLQDWAGSGSHFCHSRGCTAAAPGPEPAWT